MRNLDSCRFWRFTLCPRKMRNKFLINFWNRTILLCIPCIITVLTFVFSLRPSEKLTNALNIFICFTVFNYHHRWRPEYLPRYKKRPMSTRYKAGPSGLAGEGVGLRPLACWDFGFESHRGHGCLFLSVVCCEVEVSATSCSLVQRSATDCGASFGVI